MPHVEIPQAEFKVRAIIILHRETIIGKNEVMPMLALLLPIMEYSYTNNPYIFACYL
jgi:hypothetical protein